MQGDIWDNYRISHNPSTSDVWLANNVYRKLYFLRKDLRFFKKHLPNMAKVLIIASSTFWLADRLKGIREDIDLTCIDLSCKSLNEIKYGFVIGDALSLPFKNTCFDAVFCAYLLEHLVFPNTVNLLTEICRVLKRGGFVYLETEGTSIFHYIDLPLFLGEDVELGFFDDPSHVRPYTRRALKWLCNMAEMNPISVYRNIIWLKLLFSPIFLLLGMFLRKTKYFSYAFTVFNSVSLIGGKP